MKIALVQPEVDERYESLRQAYAEARTPPETGLAVLAAWVSEYSKTKHEIVVLDPSLGIKKLAGYAANCDVLGITNVYPNHGNCIRLAELVKNKSPDTKTVLGGPNASMLGELILKNHNCFDLVVSRDGEDALLGVVDGVSANRLPNTWHRGERGKPKFTYNAFTDLNKIPLWDFSFFQNADKRLHYYLKFQKQNDRWLAPHVGVFSNKGCIKAVTEGPCDYCTSSEASMRMLKPERFWQQLKHLQSVHDAHLFFITDDVFTVSVKRILDLEREKPADTNPLLRGYGYLEMLSKLDDNLLGKMAESLRNIGIFHLFYGSENFDESVLNTVNKTAVGIKETKRVMRTLYNKGGITTAIAVMLGFPKESEESLRKNLLAIEELSEEESFERQYISIATPLAGTPWFMRLLASRKVREQYLNATGRNLTADDNPDYGVLTEIALRESASVTLQEVNECINEINDIAEKHLPKHRIGGFFLYDNTQD